jgi:hypothetical protein
MPIRINLLSEALAEEELRRRDPVKRCIFIGFFLVVLSLVWFSTIWLDYKLTQEKKAQVEIEIDSHTNEYSVFLKEKNKLLDSEHRLASLQQLNTNRFLQGNLLNALQHIYVPNVQLLRIRLNQSFVYKEGTPDKTNSYGVVHGVSPSSTEQVTLILDGKDSSPNLDQMNRYKELLTKLDYFKSSLSSTNGVKLSNLSSPQSSVVDNKPFVLFTLECRFTDKTR